MVNNTRYKGRLSVLGRALNRQEWTKSPEIKRVDFYCVLKLSKYLHILQDIYQSQKNGSDMCMILLSIYIYIYKH